MSVNKVMQIGNLTKDPELKTLPNGSAVCNFDIAMNEKWKDKQGQLQERTEYSRIVVWGKQAESSAKFLSKGSSVFVEGKMSTRNYDKDGTKVYITEVVASNVQFLGGKKDGSAEPYKPAKENFAEVDIPF
jgi:single-strand DNA-binding protein